MRFRLGWVLAVVISSFVPGSAFAEGTGSYDVLSYHWEVKVDFAESPGPESRYRSLFSPINALEAKAKIRVRNVSNQPVEEISLILHRLMNASQIDSDGVKLEFTQQIKPLSGWETFHVQHLRVRWAEPLAAGEEANLTLRYAGQLVGYPETGMLYVQETLDPEFTILRYETFCYPQVAEPERDAVQAARRFDVFDQSLEVTVPASHVVTTAGELRGVVEENGNKTYSFASYEPSGIFMVPIAPYKIAASGRHTIFHFETSAQGVNNLQVELERAMALFTAWFGPPKIERGLTIAEIPEFFGSQSGQFILQTSGAFNNPEQYGEFYHELSHLWNPRDVDPKPCRWNEGLATFLEGVVEEHLHGEERLGQHLQAIFESLKGALAKDKKLSTVALIDYGSEEMTSRSYSTGALLFGLLQHRVGEQALLDFVRDYSYEHRESGSSDAQFAEAIVGALGEQARKVVKDWLLTAVWVEILSASESWDQLKETYSSGT